MERVHHESLEIGAVPLRDAVADLPVIVGSESVVELTARRGQAFVETTFEALDVVFSRFQVVPRSGRIVSALIDSHKADPKDKIIGAGAQLYIEEQEQAGNERRIKISVKCRGPS